MKIIDFDFIFDDGVSQNALSTQVEEPIPDMIADVNTTEMGKCQHIFIFIFKTIPSPPGHRGADVTMLANPHVRSWYCCQ